METDKVCLVIIDGWGISPTSSKLNLVDKKVIHPNLIEYDAIAKASTPFMSAFLANESDAKSREMAKGILSPNDHSSTILYAHGLHVGLPDNLMGNSEVGHLNIGAGRIVYQVCSYQKLDLFIKHFYFKFLGHC